MSLGLALGIAAAAPPPCELPDERAAYVLTMSPGGTLPSTFGHTALLLWDPRQRGASPVYDHGHFDGRDPRFAIDYALQRADYWSARRPLRRVRQVYHHRDSPVLARRVYLDPDQLDALEREQQAAAAEDERFRYHWYANNCTTRIRDAVDRATGGALRAHGRQPSPWRLRDLVLGHAGRTPLGYTLYWGHGAPASKPLPRWDAAFLPLTLDALLDGARDATGAPLAGEVCTLQGGRRRFAPLQEPPLQTDLAAAGGLAALAAAPGLRWRLWARLAGLGIGLTLALIGTVDLVVWALDAGAPWWTHHNQALASPASVALALWAAGRGGARGVVALLVAAALAATVAGLVLGTAAANAGAIGLVLPPLLVTAAALERHHRATA